MNYINTSHQKWLFYTKLLILFFIISQLWTVFINPKPFWLDEWFILENLKVNSYKNLIGRLLYDQEFPRVYLFFIKYIANLTNFSSIILKLPGTIFGVLDLYLMYYITRLIYKNKTFLRFLFIVLFSANFTIFYYFTQIKADTSDLFLALIAIVQFLNLRNKTILNIIFSSLALCLGCIISYTYPIAIAPIILIVLLRFFNFQQKNEYFYIDIIFLFSILIGLIISWFTDLRFVLTDSTMHQYWSIDIVHYDGVKDFIIYFFRSFFLLLTTFTGPTSESHLLLLIVLKIYRSFLFIIVFSGILSIVINIIKHFQAIELKIFIKNELIHIKTYFILLFIIIWVLYFLKLLPISGDRINFFTVPMIIYFFITGVLFFNNIQAIKKIFSYLLLGFVVCISLYSVGKISQNFFGKTNWFDARIYKNFGKAINYAQAVNGVIAIDNHELYDNSPASSIKIAIQSYPSYRIKTPVPVIVYENITSVCSLRLQYQKVIIVNELSFKEVNLNDICH
ncbi:MAG: hypothetical protein A3E87_01985 [Gammaproteobacteria bacterium RIFCSPHIGHO2_12_FULL_35_23]|nr:MAG: hypothetical protein A3E87_01985 [Gammaproteobacteria bacterium RIFCSPHIGHO2_12_FULL_35_23]